MAKKVLMINGSFRQKNTYGSLLQIEQILKKHNIEAEIINLFDYDIKDCIGCETCIYQNDKCETFDDDMAKIREKILSCDGLILGSPVYLSGVTSKLKTMADRTCGWFHKPEPVGLPALFVTTTAASGIGATVKFAESFVMGFGARLGGFVARTVPKLGKAIEEREIAQFLALLNTDKSEYKPKAKEIMSFDIQKALALKSNAKDRAFWEEKGWISKPYYYECRMNFAKRFFSKMMFGILSKAMK